MFSILVVEDEFDIRENLQELLESEGYKVYVASDGVQGFKFVKEYKPDLVLSDVRMPEMDGIDLLRTMQADNETSAIPFIFLSAKVELTDIRKGMINGADDYITKPFKTDDVLKAIEVRLKKKENYSTILNDFRKSFIKNVPHELRTPLISILGFSEMIEADIENLSPEEIKEMVQRINKSGKRLHKRIEKLIQYGFLISQYEKEDFAHNPMPISNDSIRSVLGPNANENNRSEDLIVDVQKSSLLINEVLFNEMLSELFDNALKFSTPGTPVSIIGKNKLKKYNLTVEDKGIGLDFKNFNDVDIFNKLDKENANREGLGLGLAIIKRISEVSGIQVKINSKENMYTRITLIIPVA